VVVKDEAWREAAYDVDQRFGPGDVAAHHAERLGESTFDHGQAIGQPVAL